MSLSALVQPNVDRIAPRDRTLDEAPPDTPPAATNFANGVDQLMRYIPAEIVTVYVPLTSAMEGSGASQRARWIAFVVFLLLTPIVTWLIFAVKVRARRQSVPRSPRQWPYWKMISALVAFVAWSTAIPHGPFWAITWFNPNYGAVVLLGTTAFLGLLGAVFEPIEEG